MLAGTASGGIYRSADDGRCWARLRAYPSDGPIGILLVPPSDRRAIIAGASYLVGGTSLGARMYRSADGGSTWNGGEAGLPRSTIVPIGIAASARGVLVLAYRCPLDMYAVPAGTHCPQGLARSVDGGRSWHPVGPPAWAAVAIVAIAATGGGFLALLLPPPSDRAFAARFYTSADDGRTWRMLAGGSSVEPGSIFYRSDGIATLFAVPWANTQIFLGADAAILKPSAYRSADGGRHWASMWQPGRDEQRNAIAGFVAAFAGLARTHTLLLSDWEAIYRSVDGGRSWTRTKLAMPRTSGLESRIWSLLATADGDTIYAGAADGAYRSTDDGRTWHMTYDAS